MLKTTHLRIARPTDNLNEVVDFYVRVLGFEELGRFADHDGYDGVMLGHPDAPYHLEFTTNDRHQAGRAPSADHLLVFYVVDREKCQEIIRHIESSSILPVRSYNPYWDRHGNTYEDPDGYRVVIHNGAWPPASSDPTSDNVV